jgi:hypothetical protein
MGVARLWERKHQANNPSPLIFDRPDISISIRRRIRTGKGTLAAEEIPQAQSTLDSKFQSSPKVKHVPTLDPDSPHPLPSQDQDHQDPRDLTTSHKQSTTGLSSDSSFPLA